MNIFKPAQTAILLLALAITAAAQQGGAASAQSAPSGPMKGKIGVINTAALQERIFEFRQKLEALNRQFDPRVKELQGMADRINALDTTIKTQANVLGAAKIAELTEQLEAMNRDYKRKGEDLQADGNRARGIALGPVNEKLTKFANEYTSKRGIALLIDLGNAVQASALTWYDNRIDVTEDFIREYNKANPAPGGTGAPAPGSKPSN
jgi:outer membrane protein